MEVALGKTVFVDVTAPGADSSEGASQRFTCTVPANTVANGNCLSVQIAVLKPISDAMHSSKEDRRSQQPL